jgi:U3 small nucleolar RNA-associated protein 14
MAPPEPSQPTSNGNRSALTRPRSPSPESNPWLTASTSTSGPSRKRNQITNATSADKAVQSLKKAKGKGTRQDDMAEDERVDIVLDDSSLSVKAPKAAGEEKAEKKEKMEKKSVTFAAPNGDKVQGDLMPSRPAMFKQRDLVAEAFAGDDVVVDFQKEKQRQMEMDAPKVEDTSLMGWVSSFLSSLLFTFPRFFLPNPFSFHFPFLDRSTYLGRQVAKE